MPVCEAETVIIKFVSGAVGLQAGMATMEVRMNSPDCKWSSDTIAPGSASEELT